MGVLLGTWVAAGAWNGDYSPDGTRAHQDVPWQLAMLGPTYGAVGGGGGGGVEMADVVEMVGRGACGGGSKGGDGGMAVLGLSLEHASCSGHKGGGAIRRQATWLPAPLPPPRARAGARCVSIAHTRPLLPVALLHWVRFSLGWYLQPHPVPQDGLPSTTSLTSHECNPTPPPVPAPPPRCWARH